MLLWRFVFFSSRRRHTRCSRDWSSDVCSSDLVGIPGGSQPQRNGKFRSEAMNHVQTKEKRNVQARLFHGNMLKDVDLMSRGDIRSEEHTSELQSRLHLVCRLLLEKKKNMIANSQHRHIVTQTLHTSTTT